jgi:hypothetical protein
MYRHKHIVKENKKVDICLTIMPWWRTQGLSGAVFDIKLIPCYGTRKSSNATIKVNFRSKEKMQYN